MFLDMSSICALAPSAVMSLARLRGQGSEVGSAKGQEVVRAEE